MDVMQEKCEKMIEMLTKRNVERKLDIAKDREDKRLTNAENEKIDYFERTFDEKKREIEDSLRGSHDLKLEELPSHFNNVSRDILTLQKYVAASNIFLRTYDIKRYQEVLQELTLRAKDLEEVLMPKKKFGFKARKPKEAKVNGFAVKTKSNDLNGKSKDEVDASPHVNYIYKLQENACGFHSEKNRNLSLDRVAILKKDVALANLDNCKIKLFGSPSTMHINSLRDSLVFCGPVSTSIFVENCSNCVFVIACQQLRLHSSSNINIYLHVTSRAIMEDCKQIYVAPYNLSYDSLDEDFQASGLNKKINNWSSIDDFNWLNAENKSPNWDVLDECRRIRDWTPELRRFDF